MAYELSSSVGSHSETTIAAVTTAVSYRGGFLSDDANILAVPTVYGNQGQAGQGTHPSVAPGIDFYTLSGGSWSFDQHMALTASSLTTGDEQRAVQQAHWVSDDEFLLTDYSKKFFRIKKVSGTWTPTHEFRPADEIAAASSYHILAAGLNPSKDVFALGQRYAFFYRKSGDTWAYEDAVGSTSGLASGLGPTSIAWSSDTAVIVGSPYDDSTREGLVRTIKYDGSGGWDKQSGVNGDWQASTDDSMFGQNIFVHTQATGSSGDAYLWISRYGVGTSNRPELLSAEITNTTNGAFSSAGFVYPSDNSGNNIAVRGRDKYDTTSITTSYASTELQYTPVHLESEQTSKLENANRNMFRIDRGSHGSGSSRQVWFGRRPSFHDDFVDAAMSGEGKTSSKGFLVANEWSAGADGWVQTILATGSATNFQNAKQTHYSPWDYSNGRAVFANFADGGSNDTGVTPSGVKILDFGSSTREASGDSTAPTITSVTSTTSDGTFKVGDSINITVNFSEAVTLSGGNLVVTLETGTTDRTVTISSISSATSASGTYTVQAGDTSADLTVSSIALSGGTLADASSNNMSSFSIATNLAASSAFVVDGTAPTITNVAISSATNGQNNWLNEDDIVSVTVTYDEAVTVVTTGGTPYVTLDIGGQSRNATYNSGTTSTAIVFTYTIASSETYDDSGIEIDADITLDGGTMKDAAGNNADLTFNAVSANSSYKVDTTKPTISSLSVADDNSTVTVTFAEAVYAGSNGTGDLVAADFALGLSGGNAGSISLNATPSAISKTSQTVWILTLNGTNLATNAAGTETLTVDAVNDTSIYDLAGNAHTAAVSSTSLNSTTGIANSVNSSLGATAGTIKAGFNNTAPRAQLNVPANALDSDTTLTVDVATSSTTKEEVVKLLQDAGAESYGLISEIVSLEPHGQQFNSAVTLIIDITGSLAGTTPSNLQVWKRNGIAEGDAWYRMPSNLWQSSTGSIEISTTSFSQYVATEGTCMKRTRLNDNQLEKIVSYNKVAPASMALTGSATALASVAAGTLFVAQTAGAAAQPVSASVLKTFILGGGSGLDLGDGDITNAGDIAADSLSIDDATAGLKIDASGANNATFEIIMEDDDADALSVKDSGGQDYMVFTSTNSAPLITFSANPTFAGRTIADLGTVTTANIDGGSVDGTTIGASSQSSVKATTLSASSTLNVAGATNLGVDNQFAVSSAGAVTTSGAISGSGQVTFEGVARYGAGQQTTISAAGLLSSSATATLHNASFDRLTVGSSVDIDGGAIDGTIIGANSAAAGTFAALVGTSLSVSDGNITNVGNIALDTISADNGSSLSFASNWTNAGRTVADLGSITTVDINGGSIDGATIGAASAGAGTFTNLTVSGDLIVTGTTTTVDSVNLRIEDSVIEIARGDGTANGTMASNSGAGIFISGSTTGKHISLLGASDGGRLKVSGSADVGTGFDVVTGGDYAIGGTSVLNATTLGGAVVASSLTSLGTIASLVATTADINDGTVDAVLGGTTPKAASVTTLSATGDVDLGNATSDTITATGRFDSDLVPSSDSAQDLGTSALQWADIHADAGYIDAMTVTGTSTLTTVDINGGAIDGTTIGASSQSSVKATTLSASSTLNVAGATNLGVDNQFAVSSAGALTTSGAISGSGQVTFEGAARFGAGQQTTISAAGVVSSSAAHTLEGVVSFGAGAQSTISAAGLLSSSATATLHNASFDRLTVGSSVNIDGGAIDGTIIGANSAAAGTFAALVGTSLNVSDGNITNVGDIALDTISADDGSSFAFGSNWTAASRTCANLGTVTTADINGGTIDGATIGATSAGAGTFTTLDCTDGAFAIANLDIDGAGDIGAGLAATDLIMVDDGANGTNRKSAVSRIGDFLVGADEGIHVSSGQLTIVPVEQVFYSGTVGNNTGAAGRMTSNLLTASLNTASLGKSLGGATGSMMVFLNGMLQTLSGSSDAPGSSVATDRCIYDYRVDKDDVGYIYLNDALDEDDVLVVKYLKK